MLLAFLYSLKNNVVSRESRNQTEEIKRDKSKNTLSKGMHYGLKGCIAKIASRTWSYPGRTCKKLYITRQAVSRWETGETTPGIDMTKLLAFTLEVPITDLLEMPEQYCQSCGMMFTGPDQFGHEADGSETEEFCRWCYDKGEYTYETTMEDMIEECAPRMAEYMNWSMDECASLLGAVLPTLKRWK